MAAIFGEEENFLKIQRVHFLDTLWVENFDEIALSRMVKVSLKCPEKKSTQNSIIAI